MTRDAACSTVRRTLELQPKTAARLDRLRELLEASSDTEVFRRALQILEGLVDDELNGRTVYVKDEATGDIALVRILNTGRAPPPVTVPKHV